MGHFGSADWPSRFGVVARLNKSVDPVSFGASGASPYSGAVEGTDLLTYTVPSARSGVHETGTGLYLLIAGFHVQTASDSSTTQTVECNVTYNNGVAVTARSLGEVLAGGMTGSTFAPLSVKTIDFHSSQFGFIRAEAGTDITMSVEAATGGLIAAVGAIDVDFTIIRIG